MIDPHEEITYLVRSENRIAVLRTLASDPKTKRAVVEETDVSAVTAGRILDSFLDRGWIRQDGDEYATTAVGDLLVADYRRLFDSMDLACRLGPVVEHVPLEQMDFDVRHLTEAAVADTESFDALRGMDRQMQLFRGADSVRGFTHRLPNFLGDVIFEEVLSGTMELEAVLEAPLVDRLLDSADVRSQLLEVTRAGAELYRADEGIRIPHHAALIDGTVAMVVHDDDGSMIQGIETSTEAIREWMHDTYESYRTDATRLTPEVIEEWESESQSRSTV
ncbi:MAG: helix-turn-helix transcriptional regulator [Salinirussus sp.]